MMRYLILFFGLISTLSLCAQAPYQGGKGDGYDQASLRGAVLSTETQALEGLEIYPNPVAAGSSWELRLPQDGKSYALGLYDLQGKLLWEMPQSRLEAAIPSETLSPGMYLLSIQQGEQQYLEKLMVK